MVAALAGLWLLVRLELILKYFFVVCAVGTHVSCSDAVVL